MAIRITNIICDTIEEAVAIVGTISVIPVDIAAIGSMAHVSIGANHVGGDAQSSQDDDCTTHQTLDAEVVGNSDHSTAGNIIEEPGQGPSTAKTPAQLAIAAATEAAAASKAAKKDAAAKKAKEKAEAAAAAGSVDQAALTPAEKQEGPAPTPPTATAEAVAASPSEEGDFFDSTDSTATVKDVEKTYTFKDVHEALLGWSKRVNKTTFYALMDQHQVKQVDALNARPELWPVIMRTIAASIAELDAVAEKAGQASA